MDDGAFGFAHVIFHLVLVAVLHGSRSPIIFKTRREQNQKVTQGREGGDQALGPSRKRTKTINR